MKMKMMYTILIGTFLATFTSIAQAVPIAADHQIGSMNITSAGSTFTHTLTLSGDPTEQSDPLLLSLSFSVSQNAAAQNDTIELMLGGTVLASGQASQFSVTNLDVTPYFDFSTGTLTFQLFRNVQVGGGNIKLRSTTLTVGEARDVPSTQFASLGFASELTQVSEPGALALLGLGLLGIAMLRRRPKVDATAI
jgi:hypothetical protein